MSQALQSANAMAQWTRRQVAQQRQLRATQARVLAMLREVTAK